MGRLDGRVAIITGAGSGNGLAIAAAYAREGARSIQSFGEALFVQTDVRSWDDIDRLVSETVQRFGHPGRRRGCRRLPGFVRVRLFQWTDTGG